MVAQIDVKQNADTRVLKLAASRHAETEGRQVLRHVTMVIWWMGMDAARRVRWRRDGRVWLMIVAYRHAARYVGTVCTWEARSATTGIWSHWTVARTPAVWSAGTHARAGRRGARRTRAARRAGTG